MLKKARAVVLHRCQGDLGDTTERPGSSEASCQRPGLCVGGQGEDVVSGTLVQSTSQVDDLVPEPGSPETSPRGGKLARLPPASCRGRVVKELGAGQVGVTDTTGDNEGLQKRYSTTSLPWPYLGVPQLVQATGVAVATGDKVGQLPGGHLAAEVGELVHQCGGAVAAAEDDGAGADLGEWGENIKQQTN